MTDIKEILENLGYSLRTDGQNWRSTRIFANGDNPTALLIRKDGTWIDFVEGKRGNLEDLVQLTLNLKTLEETKDWLNNKNYHPPVKSVFVAPKIKVPKIYDKALLNKLLPIYDYYVGRGISVDILKLFKGGLCPMKPKSQMSNRYVLPIFNSRDEIVGFTGRLVENNDYINKVKHVGQKESWVWPATLNQSEIRAAKTVIIVEGPADILSFFEVGIRNCLCLFGVTMGLNMLNFLIKLNIEKIIIATNGDLPGQNAALKLQNKLCRYFNKKDVVINHPPTPYKDFNEVLVKDPNLIKLWYQNL